MCFLAFEDSYCTLYCIFGKAFFFQFRQIFWMEFVRLRVPPILRHSHYSAEFVTLIPFVRLFDSSILKVFSKPFWFLPATHAVIKQEKQPASKARTTTFAKIDLRWGHIDDRIPANWKEFALGFAFVLQLSTLIYSLNMAVSGLGCCPGLKVHGLGCCPRLKVHGLGSSPRLKVHDVFCLFFHPFVFDFSFFLALLALLSLKQWSFIICAQNWRFIITDPSETRSSRCLRSRIVRT